MKVLVIGAHPDDETFGMGGTLARCVREGDRVMVMILTDGVKARNGDSNKQHRALVQAMNIYGIDALKHLEYSDQELDAVPLVRIVKDIEEVIQSFRPNVVYTHARQDIGQDHRRVYEATMIAARPITGVQKIISYPSPSSTYWGTEFHANLYVDITGYAHIKQRVIEEAYPHEVPDRAHPRSYAGIGLREDWIGQLIGSGGKAEEFEIIRDVR